MVKGSATLTQTASCPSLRVSTATLTRIVSSPILWERSASLMRIAKEVHFDFVRDKENDLRFEFLVTAVLQKLQEGYKSDDAGSQQCPSTEGSVHGAQEDKCPDALLQLLDPSLLCVITFHSTSMGQSSGRR